MNIPARFRAFALVLLPAFFAVLILGCAGPSGGIGTAIANTMFGESLPVYEPVGENRADLRTAKTTCNAQALQQVAPLRAAAEAAENQRYQAAAAAAAQQCSACMAAAAAAGAAGGTGLDPLQRSTCQLTACQSPSRHAVNSFDNERHQFFCSCMTQDGWKCAGTLKFRDVNAPISQAESGETPLHVVALNDNADSVSWLVSKNANVNVKDANGFTPMHWAAFRNAIQAATALLNSGADIDSQTNDGATPLQAAAAGDSDKIAALLIERGANINSTNIDEWAPLHTAARNNSRKVAGLLISEGANIEAQGGDDGMTPLHRAAFYGNVEIADLLIARGANLDAKTYADETPLDIARREGKRDVIALLERAARKAESVESATASTNDNGDAESVFENAWRSVVVVVTDDGQGGGVVINEPNQVATNCHVVDESPNSIRVYKGENRRAVRDAPHSAEIVSGDRERDVCILSVPGLWAIPAKIRPAAELEIGEEVYAVGTPRGLDFSISNGIVSQLRAEAGESAPLIQTSAAISPGSSGGGLFDSRGRLVGLTTWKIREGENLNFAIPVDWALELR